MSEETLHAVLWYQEDARYCYAQAAIYRAQPGKEWIAAKVQLAAAHSALMARRLLGLEPFPAGEG